MRVLNCLIVVLGIIFFCNIVYATGISGSNLNEYAIFQPGSTYEFNYNLVASKAYDNNYEVFANKDLAEYVIFDPVNLKNISKGSSVPFSGRIIFPSELTPGWHHAVICVIEDCPGGSSICGRASSCAQLNFMALHPGIMPVIGFGMPNSNEGEPLEMMVSVENIGKQDIAKASGRIEINDINEKLVGTAFLESKSIKSAEKVILNAHMETEGIPPGNYSATAFVDSDGIENVANASFRIGTLDVSVKGYTQELSVGSIQRFITTVKSDWNDPLNVYAQITISDDSGRSVSAKSTTGMLQPRKELGLEAFIDTTGLEEKEYDVHIDLFYAEKQSSFDGKVRLVVPAEPTSAAEPAQETEEKPSGISNTTLTIMLIIVVVVLTLVNVFLALYRKRKE